MLSSILKQYKLSLLDHYEHKKKRPDIIGTLSYSKLN
jgi:hypothetical protein